MLCISTLFGGGAERVVSIWANQLYDKGINVSVMIYGHGKGEYYVNPEVRVYTVVDTYENYKRFSKVTALRLMRKILKDVKPDVMIDFLPHTQIMMMLASTGLGISKIETVRVSPWHITDNRIVKILWKVCINRAKAIIVQTDEQKEYFSEKKQYKCITIPNPISAGCMAAQKDSFDDKPLRFMAAGRIDPQKNYPIMIEAFAKAHESYPDIRLDIYGTGKDEYIVELVKNIAKYQADRFIFYKGRSNDMVGEMLEHDVFIMTSNYEGMPNSLLEAMTLGLVCISTDCRTGPKDMIDDGVTGFLAKTGEVESVKSCIEKVACMRGGKCTEMGHNARTKMIDMCSEERSIDKLIQVVGE